MKEVSEKEIEEWFEKKRLEGKIMRNPTEFHKFGLKTLQNNVRRNILLSLGSGKRSLEEIKEDFNLKESMANFHLNMLEEALYIEKEEKEGTIHYSPTLLGESYLEYVEFEK